jgi:hypothetical protein
MLTRSIGVHHTGELWGCGQAHIGYGMMAMVMVMERSASEERGSRSRDADD